MYGINSIKQLYMYFGQANQDKFVSNILKQKRNGYFLEIGSNHPVNINNTYVLEKDYGWKGIMVEYEAEYLPLYKEHRPNSIHIIDDATTLDYKSVFEKNSSPLSFDYLQIDLHVSNRSTLKVLQNLDSNIFDTYKFATITFEHDIYDTKDDNELPELTREFSRAVFNKRGYIRVFEDINNQGVNPFEDWYVHPDLVDMVHVNKIIEHNQQYYVNHPITERTINWEHIQYI